MVSAPKLARPHWVLKPLRFGVVLWTTGGGGELIFI
jgi:hypothetical protein